MSIVNAFICGAESRGLPAERAERILRDCANFASESIAKSVGAEIASHILGTSSPGDAWIAVCKSHRHRHGQLRRSWEKVCPGGPKCGCEIRYANSPEMPSGSTRLEWAMGDLLSIEKRYVSKDLVVKGGRWVTATPPEGTPATKPGKRKGVTLVWAKLKKKGSDEDAKPIHEKTLDEHAADKRKDWEKANAKRKMTPEEKRKALIGVDVNAAAEHRKAVASAKRKGIAVRDDVAASVKAATPKPKSEKIEEYPSTGRAAERRAAAEARRSSAAYGSASNPSDAAYWMSRIGLKPWEMTSLQWLEMRDPNNGSTYTDGGKRFASEHAEFVHRGLIYDPDSIPDDVLLEYADRIASAQNELSERRSRGISVPLKSGPKDGDRNEDGLVFRNGRWHRDEEPSAHVRSGDAGTVSPAEKQAAGDRVWVPEQSPHTGRWRLKNLRTLDVSGSYSSKADAEADAARWHAQIAKDRERFAARKKASEANRAKIATSLPSEFLTSRGDGWEGNWQ